MNNPEAIICDLDGTLAILNGRNPYLAETCEQDAVNHAVLRVLTGSVFVDGRHPATVLFTSGRQEKDREPTTRWLNQHVLPFIRSWALFLRPTKDYRPDHVVKREIYETGIRDRFQVILALDDRDSIVALWRSLGIPTFQVREGGF